MNLLYSTNRNKDYQMHVEKVLISRKNEILDFFEMEDSSRFSFSIYIYDTQEELVEGLRQRGFLKDPDYMCACFKDSDQSINLFEPKDNPSSCEWSKKEYDNVIFHEQIHAIQYAIYGVQPEWLTEGIAKYLDGTYQKGICYLLENYINQREVPAMIELEEEFGRHDYDSYDYAYIMVCYLIEILGKKEFLRMIGNQQALDTFSTHLVDSAVNYYNHKFLEEKESKIWILEK